MATTITTGVLKDCLNCKLKAYLRLTGQQGVKSDCETALNDNRDELRVDVGRAVVARYRDVEQGAVVSRALLRRGKSFLLDVEMADGRFRVHFDGLNKVDGKSELGEFHYLPVLFHEGRQIRKPQRILLEALGLLLSRFQEKVPNRGVIYHRPGCTVTTIRLASGSKAAADLLSEVAQMAAAESPPKLVLNDHCQFCEFRKRCHAQAMQEDSLSLLRSLGRKELKNYARKGISTLTQLAHTFRPRRKGKRPDPRHPHRYHALHALAIRDKRIYVLGTPQVPTGAVRIYLDVEGLPDDGYIYLIGMIVCSGSGESRFSFWADSRQQEREIFEQFLKVVAQYEKPLIFCYGRYEKTFLKRMRRQVKKKRPVDSVLAALVNALSIIHAHFYFPTHSNGLKAVASCVSCSWSDENASGVQSIAWRMRWERTREEIWKQKLITYNQEDCEALRKLTDFLSAAATNTPYSASAIPNETTLAPVVRVQELDKLASNRIWGKVNFAHADLAFVNNCAYFDYQRQRVFVRTSRVIRKHRRRPGLRRNRKIRVSGYIVIAASICPACGRRKLVELARGEHPEVSRPRVKRVMDLIITAGGMRRRVFDYRAAAYKCLRCGHAFVPQRHERLAKHRHGLMSWAMYEHVAHQVSGGVLAEKFQEFFGLAVANAEIHMFKFLMASYYRTTYRALLAKLLAGPVLHVDETYVKLKTGRGYVWVFTSLEDVVFLYRPTREGDFLAGMLKNFQGVLVSDFYAAYDSIACEQQKCLIHLIRDMNQELLNNPFDEELQLVTLPFSALLKAIVATIDEHGLRRVHLRRHQPAVDQFFKVLSGRPFRSEAALALQERLLKNREKLFTFLRHDGVPWNNNNAENAIKRFAYYREGTVGAMKEAGLRDYLVLLSLYQTCRYRGVSFLKFLLSRERSIEAFSANRRCSQSAGLQLYPKRFVSPVFAKSKAMKKVERSLQSASAAQKRPSLS